LESKSSDLETPFYFNQFRPNLKVWIPYVRATTSDCPYQNGQYWQPPGITPIKIDSMGNHQGLHLPKWIVYILGGP